MTLGGFYAIDSLRGVHVLVVDDERECRDLLKSILEYCGALVTLVVSIRDALSTMKLVKPDVIVVDLAMPGEDGSGFLRTVRSLKPEDGGTVPIIAISRASEEDAGESGAGFAGHLAKPFNPWQVCQVVASVIAPPGA